MSIMHLAPALASCGPCAGWWTIGERLLICADPSEGLVDAWISCIESTCSAPCDGWIADYNACLGGSDPECQIGNYDICNDCLTGNGAFRGGGCQAESRACGADRTGCVTCSAWLAGGDPQRLCPGPTGPDSIGPAIDISICACASCASCSGACTEGYFEPSAASGTCAACIGSICSADVTACASL